MIWVDIGKNGPQLNLVVRPGAVEHVAVSQRLAAPACARCDFYTPKESTKAQLMEAKTNLQRMLSSIPLTDDEHAAVEDGQAALDMLISRLADVPTPAGPTPNQLGLPPTATLLPIIDTNPKGKPIDKR